MENTSPLVKHLNDTIFMLSFFETRLFTKEEVVDTSMVLKKLAIVLEGRVDSD